MFIISCCPLLVDRKRYKEYHPFSARQKLLRMMVTRLTGHGVVWRIVRRNPPVLSASLLLVLLLDISGGHHIVRRLCFTGSAWQYNDPVSVTTEHPLSPGLLVPTSLRVD